MNYLRLNLLALCLVTAVMLVLIFAISEGKSSNRGLIHTADALSLVYQLDGRAAGLLAARHSLNLAPDDVQRALRLSGLALDQYRMSGNTRFLGLAKTALLPWWDTPEPEVGIWLTRARILQTEHQFIRAARDLTVLNFRHPGNVEALLLETDAWRRAGEIARARRPCLKLAFAGRLDLTHYCSAEMLLSVGQARQAQALLEKVVQDVTRLPIDERNWALSIHADSLQANGHQHRAARLWEDILQTTDLPLSYRLAYADLLLTLEDWAAVKALLQDYAEATAVLLRLTIAAKGLKSADYPQLHEQLALRFQLSADSDDGERYQRDRAIYALSVLDDPATALDLALGNWALQKGWEDTELVVQIARITGDGETLRRVDQWRKSVEIGKL